LADSEKFYLFWHPALTIVACILRKTNRLQWLLEGIRIQSVNHWLQWIGHHSLFVYFIQQPVLLWVLYLYTFAFSFSPDAVVCRDGRKLLFGLQTGYWQGNLWKLLPLFF